MRDGRVRKAASKRVTAWSEQTLPGWWTVFTVLAGAGFFLYLGYSFIAPSPPPPAASRVAAPARTPDAAPAVTRTSAPTSTTAPSTSQEAGDVAVRRWDGTSQTVPRAALSVATASFKALFDPAAAASVAVAGGGHLPAPAQALPDATVAEVSLASQGEPGRLFFSALVDYDGPAGPATPAPVYRTIALIGGQWVAMNTTG